MFNYNGGRQAVTVANDSSVALVEDCEFTRQDFVAKAYYDHSFGRESSMMRILVLTLVLLGLSTVTAVAEEKVDFAKQVLPILQENCGKCHGEKRASGKMRVHTAAALKEKWDADKALIKAGKPEESELYKRLV